MINSNTSAEKSYNKHLDDEKNNRVSNNLPSCYSNPESIDAWRHDRMRNNILPLMNLYSDAKWITLGDGRFGSDAYYLKKHGLDVLATSISDETISVAHELGFIDKYDKANAENIKKEDNSFDFVFCKEAFHHFPRPFIALYEMLRVADKGVVLIEPQENKSRLLDYLKRLAKKILRKNTNLYFEVTGNFIYRINLKELSKVMTAINLKYVAYKRLNDFYFSAQGNNSMKTWNKAKLLTLFGVAIQNILCKLRLMDYGLAAVVLFKEDVTKEKLKELKKNGFYIIELPVNPYL